MISMKIPARQYNFIQISANMHKQFSVICCTFWHSLMVSIWGYYLASSKSNFCLDLVSHGSAGWCFPRSSFASHFLVTLQFNQTFQLSIYNTQFIDGWQMSIQLSLYTFYKIVLFTGVKIQGQYFFTLL